MALMYAWYCWTWFESLTWYSPLDAYAAQSRFGRSYTTSGITQLPPFFLTSATKFAISGTFEAVSLRCSQFPAFTVVGEDTHSQKNDGMVAALAAALFSDGSLSCPSALATSPA